MKTLMAQPATDISALLTIKRLAAVAVVLGCLAWIEGTAWGILALSSLP